jgi:hypothetical protein
MHIRFVEQQFMQQGNQFCFEFLSGMEHISIQSALETLKLYM